jgi:hypothetical protein
MSSIRNEGIDKVYCSVISYPYTTGGRGRQGLENNRGRALIITLPIAPTGEISTFVYCVVISCNHQGGILRKGLLAIMQASQIWAYLVKLLMGSYKFSSRCL